MRSLTDFTRLHRDKVLTLDPRSVTTGAASDRRRGPTIHEQVGALRPPFRRNRGAGPLMRAHACGTVRLRALFLMDTYRGTLAGAVHDLVNGLFASVRRTHVASRKSPKTK